jgi:hypothetical protein
VPLLTDAAALPALPRVRVPMPALVRVRSFEVTSPSAPERVTSPSFLIVPLALTLIALTKMPPPVSSRVPPWLNRITVSAWSTPLAATRTKPPLMLVLPV